MFGTAVFSVMSTFASSLCGFSLRSSWVCQSLEASSSQPIKQHGDSAPYSPLVTYGEKYDMRIQYNPFLTFVDLLRVIRQTVRRVLKSLCLEDIQKSDQ